MADPPNGLSPQQQPLSPPPPSQGRARRVTFATWGGILLLVYLLGPVIFLARGIQLEAGERPWHAEERWSRVRGSAFLSLLCYLPVLVFAPALAGFWISLFGGLADWSRLPLFRWLGGTAFWLPIPSSLLLRWVLALPLTSCIALLLEALQPRTAWEAKRVLSPDEQAHLAAEQEVLEKKRQAALARRARTQLTASKKPGSIRKPSRPSTRSATPSTTPAAKHTASLWDELDWGQVPDDHPLKKAALEEAERQAAARRNAERTQRVLDQMARQETATPASGSMDTSPAPPVPAPPSYNWDEGEGTVRES